MTTLLWSLMGILAGAFVALQAPINAQLGRDLGSPVAAAGVSFFAGAVVLGLATIFFARLQGISLNFRAPPPWLFIAGGVLGAAFVTNNVILVQKVGAATLIALLMTGQLLAGLLMDRIGFMGLAVREITAGRIAGVFLLMAGALMIRLY
ncbi:DMT family transporter [Tianweitania sediminis]|uniref:DMT family transporter n=1 Tax=Tianweitania sediminis TaxID=1502156 RepID=A0A8J7RPK0_9HYPH|nr:DMT family transporter [Tianweitania sediminis]MBP0440826.1 DMT family transporter [Tianweitania sediminis]